MAWAYDMKRSCGFLCRKEYDRNGSTREKEEMKALEKMVGQCEGC